MSEPAITLSVIIPVYNAENTIRETLDSVLGQSLKAIEIICVDDGSRDRSVDVIHEYMERDPRVSLICQQNKFAGPARNAGVEAAKGEYLFFLDADDYVLDYALEAVCAKAREHRLDCLKFLALTLDEKERRYVDKPRNSGGLLDTADYDRLLKVEKNSPLLRVGVTPWSGIYRRAFVLEKNCRFNHLRCVNDRSFWTKVMTNAERIMVARDRVTVHRVSQDQSLVGRRAAHFDCQIESARLTENQLREDGVSPEAASLIMQQEYVDLTVWYNRFSVNPEQKAEMDGQIREYLDGSGTAFGDMLRKRLSKGKSPSRPDREVKPFHDPVPEPAVSVLVPVRHTAESLDRALVSLTNQTLEEMEFLLLDADGTDLNRIIMKEYAAVDRRFRIIDASGVNGYGQLMNLGLEQAKGRWIGILDPDDFVSADMYERLWKQAERLRLDLIQSDYTCFRITPEGRMETRSVRLFADESCYYRTIVPERKKQVFSMPDQTGNALYRRAFLQKAGICWEEKPDFGTDGSGFRDRVLSAARRARFQKARLYCELARETDAFVPDAEEPQAPAGGLVQKVRNKCREGKEMFLEYGAGFTARSIVKKCWYFVTKQRQ